MRRFDLAEPSNLDEACALLTENGEAKAIAGGTAFLTLIKHGIFVPKTLVNLKKIKAGNDIIYI
jgi:CO/xanthine dehydrogenase FAD-binding subunit